ncbi:F-box domain, Leucine-rich repeat domain, L domain-like protein [Artemisia annua]|uniref:F-box domain, Leucine-rich repeat domain, L domain-like protein n=1 Tax=Artemisia annua TaxID=35608 RepID=A0A2U1KL47_ARTAN|nr:F-box domain, Leucine-rich repeat domain, L domain-like protein [Artemisia annua]
MVTIKFKHSRIQKSLIRMRVLSKQWFALTTYIPLLYSNLGAWSNFFSQEIDTFYRYVEYAVSRFCDQDISAHTLDMYVEYLYLEQIELFGRCLESLIKKGLQVLVIRILSLDTNLPMYRLPNTLLSASFLTSLTLHKCELPLFLMDDDVNLKSLRLLSLIQLPIEEGVIEYMIKGCPLLEEIYLRFCYGFSAFCVNRHHNLQRVTIYSNIGLQRIDVDAPNLSYFI